MYGIQTAIDQYGWEKLVKFDEMIMMNFTIMGPVYPLNEMFECMDAALNSGAQALPYLRWQACARPR